MEQKSYSRRLIVLRAVISGYTGHVRLVQSPSGQAAEIRIQSPDRDALLHAAVVSRCENGYRGRLLGELNTDNRGVATASFDLNGDADAELIAIVAEKGEECLLAMSGFLKGSSDVSWSGVRAAACAAVTGDGSCIDAVPASEALPEDDAPAEALPEDSETAAPPEIESRSADQPATAMAEAGIDPDAEWPEEIESLKPLFETCQSEDPCPDLPYTFIYVPVTVSQPSFYAGIQAKHGRPCRVAYALYGTDPSLPPQGLEEFKWHKGKHGGLWVIELDAVTGSPVH